MASPDATPYVNLSLFDVDPQDVFDNAQTSLQINIPDWVPREGNIEVLLLEALAGMVSEGIFAINRLPDGIMQGLLQLFGIARDNGTAPVANLEFTMSGTAGYTISAGVSARLTLPGGLPDVVFTTDMDLVIAPGNSTGIVTAVADRLTDDANNVLSGTVLEFLDAVIAVESVTIDSIAVGGTDPESDADYFTRGATRFSRLSDTLVLPRHFTAYALENPAVERATTLDNWDGSGGSPGDDPGHVTVAVYGNGATLSGPAKTALAAEMDALSITNLVVHVIDPTITTINVTTTVRALPGFTQAAVQANVQNALNNYLDPQTWGWGTTVWWTELITVISTAEGVDFCEGLSVPAGNTSLSGFATLVDAGTLNVTVNLP